MREVAGRRQSRFAECPAKRAKDDAIVSDGLKRRGSVGLGEVSETLSEGIRERFAACRIL